MSPRRNWDSPTPSISPASVPLSPDPKGGSTLAQGWGVGGVPIPATGENLSKLYLLRGQDPPTVFVEVKITGFDENLRAKVASAIF